MAENRFWSHGVSWLLWIHAGCIAAVFVVSVLAAFKGVTFARRISGAVTAWLCAVLLATIVWSVLEPSAERVAFVTGLFVWIYLGGMGLPQYLSFREKKQVGLIVEEIKQLNEES